MTPRNVLLTFAAGIAITGCRTGNPGWISIGTQGMVAADSTHASRAGLEMLKAGGNAIDAAAAVSFAGSPPKKLLT